MVAAGHAVIGSAKLGGALGLGVSRIFAIGVSRGRVFLSADDSVVILRVRSLLNGITSSARDVSSATTIIAIGVVISVVSTRYCGPTHGRSTGVVNTTAVVSLEGKL